MHSLAKDMKITDPKIIGWDFPYLSQEQVNIYHMHGYTGALVVPDKMDVGIEIESRKGQCYVTLTIKDPMTNPFNLISNAFKSVFQYIKVNGYGYDHFGFEHLYLQGNEEYMKICVAIKERIA